jgi:hypothetical protein
LIVVVEGEADQIFFRAVVAQRFPDAKISVIRADGEGRILEKLYTLQEALGDLATSPYRDRLFVVIDSVSSSRIDRLIDKGVREENIIRWRNNGIEYVYPKSIMGSIFLCGGDYRDSELRVDKATVEIREIAKGKMELARAVAEKVGPGVEFCEELEAMLGKLRRALSGSSDRRRARRRRS